MSEVTETFHHRQSSNLRQTASHRASTVKIFYRGTGNQSLIPLLFLLSYGFLSGRQDSNLQPSDYDVTLIFTTGNLINPNF